MTITVSGPGDPWPDPDPIWACVYNWLVRVGPFTGNGFTTGQSIFLHEPQADCRFVPDPEALPNSPPTGIWPEGGAMGDDAKLCWGTAFRNPFGVDEP